MALPMTVEVANVVIRTPMLVTLRSMTVVTVVLNGAAPERFVRIESVATRPMVFIRRVSAMAKTGEWWCCGEWGVTGSGNWYQSFVAWSGISGYEGSP
jgi:hypothetical protein